MSKKIKFNVEDLFIEGQHVADFNEIVRAVKLSPLFPSIACVYSQAPDLVRIGALIRDKVSGQITSMNIVSPVGANICRFHVTGEIGNNGTVGVSVPWASFSSAMDRHALSTTNPRYLHAKIKPTSNHIAAETLRKCIGESRTAFQDRIQWTLETMIDSSMGRRMGASPFFSFSELDDSTSTFIARVIAGEVSLAEMSTATRQKFDDAFKKYTERRAKFKQEISKCRDFFDSEKWVYLPDINEGVVLGAVQSEPMLGALDHYAVEGALPRVATYDYFKETVPLKWYKSFEHIPDELRSQLEYSLAMLKAHRGSSELLPREDVTHFWYEMGCGVVSHGTFDSRMLLLAR